MNTESQLNPQQLEAVSHTEGPVLILAGAGSGKTRVLTQRVAHLIAEKHVAPWNILAITFTNKAAREMKERVENALGTDAHGVLVATFHATCVRILRGYADRIGYDTHFTIYDSDDSRTLMKQIVKRDQLETVQCKLRRFLFEISGAKDHLRSPDEYLSEHRYERDADRIAHAYRAYQRALREANAMDFDDLIMNTVMLFRNHPDVLETFQERFRYICVDEYQDTNNAQFELIRLLADKYRNLCVVGDDDQSIYRFRGANIHNILDFERVYPDAFVVKLEQNYRSKQTILSAANAVIKHNHARKEKSLWSERGEGNLIRVKVFPSAVDEAEYVAQEAARLMRTGEHLSREVAVLYRTNAQSRLLEERFVREGIAYELVGGVNFYARREIKDILAYLKTIEHPRDELAIRRIINVPKRGIGAKTIEDLSAYALQNGISFADAIEVCESVLSAKSAAKVRLFADQIDVLRQDASSLSVAELIRKLIDMTDYETYLAELRDSDALPMDDDDRLHNVEELISKAADYDETAEEPSLYGFLEEVALIADIDMTGDDRDRAMLMTLHAAKGLEFSHVFITGMEENLFPGFQTITSAETDPAAMEEERRLAYVGITRAKDTLTLTSARARMINGETHYNPVSRFLTEIPQELLDKDEGTRVSFRDADVIRKKEKPYAADAIRKLDRIAPKTAFAQLKKGAPQAEKPDYETGDRVRHVKFGAGTVKELTKEPRDYKVTVDFDTAGTKVMYAAFARLEKIG